MAKLSALGTLRWQYSKHKHVTRKDLSGKTVMVLGANIGIGFEAAKHFASMSPGKLVLACRSKAKGEEAAAKIRDSTGCKTVEVRIVDLADFESVRKFAQKFIDEESRLDILVANAAIMTFDYSTTKDGWESTIQVNHLSNALTALLLLPKMIETVEKHNTTPRLTFVASSVHYWTELDATVLGSENMLEKLSEKEYCTKKIMERRYNDSKLLIVFFTRALASHLSSGTSKSPQVTIDCVCPGYCYSSLRRDWSGIRNVIDKVLEVLVAWPAEKGARQLVYAALAGKEEDMHGQFMGCYAVREPSDFVISNKGSETQERSWSETVTILSKVEPGVQEIVGKYLTARA